jgi:phosphate transport system permease protein
VLATSGTNIEEARPVAFGTALVLILIVLITNLFANGIRAYYNNKYKK